MSIVKIPIERVMEMSLEEYIEETGIYNPNYREKLRQKYKTENNNNQSINSTDNGDDFIMLDTTETDDIFSVEDMPKPSSSQWRLLPPNVPDHPVGMPPLVPLKAEILHNCLRGSNITFDNKDQQYRVQQKQPQQQQQQHQQNNGTAQNNQTNKQQNQRYNGGRQNQNRQMQNKSNMNNLILQNNGTGFVNKRRNRNGNRQRNNYRKFHGINNNNQSKPSNIQHRLYMHNGLNQQNAMGMGLAGTNSNKPKSLLDLEIKTENNNNEMQLLPTKLADNNNNKNNNTSNMVAGENFLKNCFNTLPVIAAQLLEQIDSIRNVKNEKKYDMKVQKEISEIQGKQLLYTCPGASVVSFDGPGIDCDTPKPHTTDMSLNQRFA